MEQALKPCPFCEGDELGHGYDYPPGKGIVQCYSCDAFVTAETEAEAIEAWNRRAPAPAEAGATIEPWPLAGYAPGNYLCKCNECGGTFEGDKRAWTCLECAVVRSKRAATPAPAEAGEVAAVASVDKADAWDAIAIKNSQIASLRAEVERVKRECLRLKIDASNHAADAETVRRERDAAEAEVSRLTAERDRYKTGLQVLATTFYKNDQHQDYAKHVLAGRSAEGGGGRCLS